MAKRSIIRRPAIHKIPSWPMLESLNIARFHAEIGVRRLGRGGRTTALCSVSREEGLS